VIIIQIQSIYCKFYLKHNNVPQFRRFKFCGSCGKQDMGPVAPPPTSEIICQSGMVDINMRQRTQRICAAVLQKQTGAKQASVSALKKYLRQRVRAPGPPPSIARAVVPPLSFRKFLLFVEHPTRSVLDINGLQFSYVFWGPPLLLGW